jgi:hypothetical protein
VEKAAGYAVILIGHAPWRLRSLAPTSCAQTQDEKKRPSLLKPEEDCPPVDMKEYKPGESIESLCPLPSASSPEATGGAASK